MDVIKYDMYFKKSRKDVPGGVKPWRVVNHLIMSPFNTLHEGQGKMRMISDREGSWSKPVQALLVWVQKTAKWSLKNLDKTGMCWPRCFEDIVQKKGINITNLYPCTIIENSTFRCHTLFINIQFNSYFNSSLLQNELKVFWKKECGEGSIVELCLFPLWSVSCTIMEFSRKKEPWLIKTTCSTA